MHLQLAGSPPSDRADPSSCQSKCSLLCSPLLFLEQTDKLKSSLSQRRRPEQRKCSEGDEINAHKNTNITLITGQITRRFGLNNQRSLKALWKFVRGQKGSSADAFGEPVGPARHFEKMRNLKRNWQILDSDYTKRHHFRVQNTRGWRLTKGLLWLKRILV